MMTSYLLKVSLIFSWVDNGLIVNQREIMTKRQDNVKKYKVICGQTGLKCKEWSVVSVEWGTR